MKLNLIIIFLLAVTFPINTYAQGGILVLKKGIIKVRHEETKRIYHTSGEKVTIHPGDKIHTGKDTRAKIFLRDNSEEILLYSNTFFKVESVEKKRSLLRLWIGKAKFLVKPYFDKVVGKRVKRSFDVKTLTALLGVKGTEFVVKADKDGTSLYTSTGTVAFANRIDPEVEVEVTKNQISLVRGTEYPTEPTVVTEEEGNTIIESDTTYSWFEIPETADNIIEDDNPIESILEDLGEVMEEVESDDEITDQLQLKLNFK